MNSGYCRCGKGAGGYGAGTAEAGVLDDARAIARFAEVDTDREQQRQARGRHGVEGLASRAVEGFPRQVRCLSGSGPEKGMDVSGRCAII